MTKRQISIRTLLIVTLLVAVLMPFAISHYDDFIALMTPQSNSPTKSSTNAVYTIPPIVSGVVLRTRGELAAISLGTDDGVQIGQNVIFQRDGQTIGSGVISKAENNIGACRITDGEILQGDYATIDF